VIRSLVAHARSAALLAVLLIIAGCGRETLIEDIEYHERILNRYDEPSGATILITRWGTLIRKWRITDELYALLYQVDSNTQVCETGGGIVDCDALRRDRDMRRFINW